MGYKYGLLRHKGKFAAIFTKGVIFTTSKDILFCSYYGSIL